MAVKGLGRLLSELGVATRSEPRQINKSGRVTVDGTAAAQPDMKIEEQGHSIAWTVLSCVRTGCGIL